MGPVVEPEPAEAKKCKKEDKKCDKKKCKKKNKKCCCKNLKCKNGRARARAQPVSPTPISTLIDSFNGGDTFNKPWGITTDPDGNVYVTDRDNERVLAFNQNGNFLDEFGEHGQGGDEFEIHWYRVQQRSNGNLRLYVADHVQNDNDGGSGTSRGTSMPAISATRKTTWARILMTTTVPIRRRGRPQQQRLDHQSESPGTIFLFNRDADFLATFEPALSSSPGDDADFRIQGIAVFKDDNDNEFVYVADTGNNRIVKFRHVSNDPENGLEYVTEVGNSNGSCGSGNNEFNRPIGLATDECGNVWVADRSTTASRCSTRTWTSSTTSMKTSTNRQGLSSVPMETCCTSSTRPTTGS